MEVTGTLPALVMVEGGVLNVARSSGATPEPPAATATMPSPAEPPARDREPVTLCMALPGAAKKWTRIVPRVAEPSPGFEC